MKQRLGIRKLKTTRNIMQEKKGFNELILTRIRKYITQNDLSLTALGDNFGLTYPEMYAVIYYKKTIDLPTYIGLCRMLDLPVDFFTADLFNS